MKQESEADLATSILISAAYSIRVSFFPSPIAKTVELFVKCYCTSLTS